jgi:Ferric uptake regulator family
VAPRQPDLVLGEAVVRLGYRLTGPRRVVADVLAAAREPLTVAQIHQAAGPNPPNLASVYRAIHLLARTGLARMTDAGRSRPTARYELTEPFAAHHHHLICQACAEAPVAPARAGGGLPGDGARASAFRPLPGVPPVRRLLGLLVLVALTTASPSVLHEHGGHGGGVYDDNCSARLASLCGVGLPAEAVPPAPSPLPAAERPAAPASTGLGTTSASALQPRAPPSSPA